MDPAVAKRILDDCIKAGDISIEKFMKYSKSRHGQGPCWEEIWVSRHALGDVLVHSKGRLLRMVAWENQVRDLFLEHGIKLSDADVSLVARRCRLMLSHLRNAKIKGSSPPARFAPLQFLVNAMHTEKKAELIGDESSGSGSDKESEPEVIVQICEVYDVPSDGEAIVTCASGRVMESELDDLVADFMLKPKKQELPNVTPPQKQELPNVTKKRDLPNVTPPKKLRLRSKTPAAEMTHKEIDALVESTSVLAPIAAEMNSEEIDSLVASATASAPTAAEYRQIQKERKEKKKGKKGKKGKKKAMKSRKNKGAEKKGKKKDVKEKEDAKQKVKKSDAKKKEAEAQGADEISAYFSQTKKKFEGHAHVEHVKTETGRKELAKIALADFEYDDSADFDSNRNRAHSLGFHLMRRICLKVGLEFKMQFTLERDCARRASALFRSSFADRRAGARRYEQID